MGDRYGPNARRCVLCHTGAGRCALEASADSSPPSERPKPLMPKMCSMSVTYVAIDSSNSAFGAGPDQHTTAVMKDTGQCWDSELWDESVDGPPMHYVWETLANHLRVTGMPL